MAKRDEPEQIEIELTSYDPPGARTALQASDDVVTAVSTDVETAVVEVERNRLIVAGSMVGLVALLLGFVLGRAGSADEAGAPAAQTSDAPSTSVDESLTSIEPPTAIKDLEPPPTTEQVSRTTITTEPPSPEVGSIAIHPVLDGQEMELITLNGRGELVIVDVASGETTTYDTGRFNNGGPGNIIAGDNWVLLPDFNGGGESTIVFDDGTQDRIETGPGWRLLMADGSDNFWRFDTDGDTPSRAIETRLNGEATGVEIDLPAPPIAADPLGGLVVSTGSGAYRVEVGGVEQLTSGWLVALGRQRMLVHECDDELRCSYIVEDRSTGGRQVLDVTGIDDGAQLNSGGWYPFWAQFDSDETRLLVTMWQNFVDGPPARGVLDLASGEFTEIDVNDDFADMLWSADGQFVFWVDGGTLKVLDPDTGESVPLSDELGRVESFAIRPSG